MEQLKPKRLKIFHTKGESESRIEEDVNNWLAKNPQNVIHQRQLHFLRGERSNQIEYVIEIWYEVGQKPVPEAKKVPPEKISVSPFKVIGMDRQTGKTTIKEIKASDPEEAYRLARKHLDDVELVGK